MKGQTWTSLLTLYLNNPHYQLEKGKTWIPLIVKEHIVLVTRGERPSGKVRIIFRGDNNNQYPTGTLPKMSKRKASDGEEGARSGK